MCRLFAMLAERPTSVAAALVDGANSLRRQSCRDADNGCHRDGWGIGYYLNGKAVHVRSIGDASSDPLFEKTAKNVKSHAVLAHVRQASAGTIRIENCHPFIRGPWAFMHDGDLAGFDGFRDQLQGEIAPEYRETIAGDTDTEYSFGLFLTQLKSSGRTGSDPGTVAATLGDTVRRLRHYTLKASKKSEFNFVASDGSTLYAVRLGHTLFWRNWRGGIQVASQPATEDDWTAVPEGTILVADSSWQLRFTAID